MPSSKTTALVVIGAGYGDEGKGLLTDALAAPYGRDAVVVRFNGGAQAGHTVTLADGRRHIFHHVGSGAFADAKTFLSRFFVANPMLLLPELDDLAAKGVIPALALDPEAPVTTPWDMMLNQFAEVARGKGRHGSCGLGFGETLERSQHGAFLLTAAMLRDAKTLPARLEAIRRRWVPARLAALGLTPDDEQQALIGSTAVTQRWLADLPAFLDAVEIAGIETLAQARAVIFEGAQGLGLDQTRGAFPHVTRSNTGLKNVLALAGEAGLAELDVTYATRAYATRHGAGPLEHALPGPPAPGVTDATNIDNPWQGKIRFGHLDLDALAERIQDDLGDVSGSGVVMRHCLAMTCLDQMGESATFVEGDVMRRASPEGLAARAAQMVGAMGLVGSWGPTREGLGAVERLAKVG